MLNCLNKEISIQDVEKRLIDADYIVVLHSHGLLSGVKKSHISFLHKNIVAIAFDFQNLAIIKTALLKACENENSLVVISSYYQTWIQKWLVAELKLQYLKDFITSEHIEIIALPGIARGIGVSFYRHYLENIQKINHVLALLCDDYSKETFLNILNFRINHFSVAMLEDDKIPLSKEMQVAIENKAKEIESSINENIPLYLRSNIAFKLAVDEYQYQNKITLENKQSILNCGAYNNSSVVFSILSPKAKVFAFEPQLDVHKQNIVIAKSIPNIVPINKGLWKENTRLFFHTRIDSSGSSTGSKLIEEENEGVFVLKIVLHLGYDTPINPYNPLLHNKSAINKNVFLKNKPHLDF